VNERLSVNIFIEIGHGANSERDSRDIYFQNKKVLCLCLNMINQYLISVELLHKSDFN